MKWILLFTLFTTHCLAGSLEDLSKQEAKLVVSIDLYRSRTIESEKFDARTSLLKLLGQTAEMLKPILTAPNISEGEINGITELLAKIDPYDYEHIVLEEIEPEMKKHLSEVEKSTSALRKQGKISKKEEKSLNESIAYLKMGTTEEKDQ